MVPNSSFIINLEKEKKERSRLILNERLHHLIPAFLIMSHAMFFILLSFLMLAWLIRNGKDRY